jgi:hypothetical protein
MAKLKAVESLLDKHIESRPSMTRLRELTESRNNESERLRQLMFELKEVREVEANF